MIYVKGVNFIPYSNTFFYISEPQYIDFNAQIVHNEVTYNNELYKKLKRAQYNKVLNNNQYQLLSNMVLNTQSINQNE